MSQKVYGVTIVISERVVMDDYSIVALQDSYAADIDADDVRGFIQGIKDLPQVYQVRQLIIKLEDGEQ